MSEIQLSQIDYELVGGRYKPTSRTPDTLRGLYPPEIDYEDLRERLTEANDSYEVITGSTGRRYEVAVLNHAKLSSARILHPSTSFSSLYKNPGNALELALTATANPGAAYIYVASFGNYPSGHMDARDLHYVAKTGRYTTGDGSSDHPYKPLESVTDMAETLAERGLAPTHFSADVEAGRLALGLACAFESDSVDGLYLNGLDGISHSAKYASAKLSEDLRSRIRRRGIGSGQPGELTPFNIKDVKRQMPNVYSKLGRIAHLAPLPVLLFPGDVKDKLYTTNGFRQHDNLDMLADHAVFQDLQAALRRQDTTITLQFNKNSAIHNDEDCVRLGELAMNAIPSTMRTEDRRVRVLVGEGGLDEHTDAPYGRTRVERYAFADIRHLMLGALRLALSSEVHKPQLQKVA